MNYFIRPKEGQHLSTEEARERGLVSLTTPIRITEHKLLDTICADQQRSETRHALVAVAHGFVEVWRDADGFVKGNEEDDL